MNQLPDVMVHVMRVLFRGPRGEGGGLLPPPPPPQKKKFFAIPYEKYPRSIVYARQLVHNCLHIFSLTSLKTSHVFVPEKPADAISEVLNSQNFHCAWIIGRLAGGCF